QRRHVGPEGTARPYFEDGEGTDLLRIARDSTSPFGRPWNQHSRVAWDLEQDVRQHLANITSRANAPLQVTFGLQLLESVNDRSSRQSILNCEITRTRKPKAGVQFAFQNSPAQPGIQPTIDRCSRLTNRQHEIECSASLTHEVVHK